MEFSDFIQILKRSWWIFILVFLLVLIVTAYFTYKQKPVYRATVTVIISPDENIIGSDDFIRSLSTLERRSFIATAAKILSSRTIEKKAISRLKTLNSQTSDYNISSSVLPDTNIISISVKSTNRNLVAEVANAIYEEGQNYIKDFYKYFGLKLLDPAITPSSSEQPSFRRNLSIAIVLGILLGIAAMILLDYVFQRPRTHK